MLATLAACGHAAAPTVPTLSGGANATQGSAGPNAQTGDAGQARKDKLHAAAECIRQHGIPTYQDPVLTSDGHVFTDARSMQNADEPTLQAVQSACAAQIAAAQFQPDAQAPAPPALVQAGVKTAQCLRAHGLPNIKDPTSTTVFVPGHGFGLTPDEVPAGGKQNPVVQQALEACRSVENEETRLSTLENLGHA